MEMHELRYVVAVSRAGNFPRAAAQSHVSQPSLGQQILKLEEELGERLFDRMKREARLTPHGEASGVVHPSQRCGGGINEPGKLEGRIMNYEVFERFRMVTKIAVSSSH